MKVRIVFIICIIYSLTSCQSQISSKSEILDEIKVLKPSEIRTGADKLFEWIDLIEDKNVGVIVNQTSVTSKGHIVDVLIENNIKVQKIFTPEHGFRGTADAGEQIIDGVDTKTKVPIASLYGKKKKPSNADLSNIDIMIFDIQDIGVRFYTYISTLHYIMEACAENDIKLIVLDRPNPNGFYIDGPVLEKEFTSFVGIHPVPIVHGMTIGEYARMINGEGWLANAIQCNLEVITCDNYKHEFTYDLPIKPSPNLPNLKSILLYPSICFFEGTQVSVGRGTTKQFQVLGMPNNEKGDYKFTPISMEGAKYPKHENIECIGSDLSNNNIQSLANDRLNLSYLQSFVSSPKDSTLINRISHFDRLAGTDTLRKQLLSGLSVEEIKKSWAEDLAKYQQVRSKYLLYN